MTGRNASVPCNGCTACCRNELVLIDASAGDDPSRYAVVPATNPLTGEAALALARRPDGSCVYLNPVLGCSIHGSAPIMCRAFDCRRLFLKLKANGTAGELRRALAADEVLRAGKARVGSLGAKP